MAGGLALFALVPAFALDNETAQTAARTLMEKYCFDCHGDGMSKGKIALNEMLTSGSRAEWGKAWKILRHEFMPPAGEDRPTAAERQAITDWIARDRLGVNFEQPDPGRVTLRRLNRMEYEYSVTDLFGVDFSSDQNYSSDGAAATLKLRDRLPPDDTAFGFDNIGDFQSVSPALLEKFFDIAEFVVDRVVARGGPPAPETVLDRGAIKVTTTAAATKRTDHEVEFEIKEPGTFRLEMQFTLGGWQEYGGAYDFNLRIDDAPVAADYIEIGGYKTFKYSSEIKLAAGGHAVAFSTVARKPDSKGTTNHLELKPKIKLAGPLGTGAYDYPESHRRIFFQGDAPADADGRRAYARKILRRVASRAFRRPVDGETLEGLTTLAESHENFEDGIAQALTAILTSPKFLFRAETQPRPDDPKFVHPIDEFALASRLSYLLWLSLPDDELTRLAERGQLRENLRAQVKRMMVDPRSERFMEDFPGQWLRTRNVLMTAISRDDLLDPVRGAMKRETEMLFEHIARGDRDLIELITADYTFVNKRLADFYGLKGVEEDKFQKVALAPETHRGGLLTHGSFLVASSNPNRTSPVKRGLFVLENLLAVEPPPPPPGIPPLDEAKVGDETPKSVREQLEAHRANKSCAACHAHFDPIGVVLENYDLIGQWRDEENGQKIDPRATTVTGETVQGIDDLRKLFAARKDKFYRGVTEKLLTYALGRGLEPFDAVTVDRIAARVSAENGKFSTLLLGIVESPAFQTRRGDAGETLTIPRMNIPATPPPEKRRPQRRRRNVAATNIVGEAVINRAPPARPAAKPPTR
jgi:PAS domain-containing protein